jgi:hypothetical protein
MSVLIIAVFINDVHAWLNDRKYEEVKEETPRSPPFLAKVDILY